MTIDQDIEHVRERLARSTRKLDALQARLDALADELEATE